MSNSERAPRGGRSGFWRPSVVFACLSVGYALFTVIRPEPEAPPPEPLRAHAALASSFTGVATISDGDTLRLGARRIRLHGIVAPQHNVQCGEINGYRASADALRAATRTQAVVCQISALPQGDGQDIARCYVGDADLSEHMVASGWARRTGDAYADAQAEARAARRGLWGLSCPADLWRGTPIED